ncbi:MAG: hypothetical protein MZV70_68460 [Desulfobacterales bacterium]|nr:hypothetical protein [Desulfobacterales bacterium]
MADVIEPDAAAATAVEAALGESLQYIIVERQQAGTDGDRLPPAPQRRPQRLHPGRRACTTPRPARRSGPDPAMLLLQHVAVKPGFEPIAQALLGNVVLTETLAEAVALFNQQRAGSRPSSPATATWSRPGVSDRRQPRRVQRHPDQEAGAAGAGTPGQGARAEAGAAPASSSRRHRGRGPRPGRGAAEADRAEEPGAAKAEIEAEKALYKASEELKAPAPAAGDRPARAGAAAGRGERPRRRDRARPTGRWRRIAADIEAAQNVVADGSQPDRRADRPACRSSTRRCVNFKLEMTALNARLENSTNSLQAAAGVPGRRACGAWSSSRCEIGQKTEKAAACKASVEAMRAVARRHVPRRSADLDQDIERNEIGLRRHRRQAQEERRAHLRDQGPAREDPRAVPRARARADPAQAQARARHRPARGPLPDPVRRAAGAQLAPAAEAVPPNPRRTPRRMEAELAPLPHQDRPDRRRQPRAPSRNTSSSSERHEFLQAQKDDLEKAIEDLHKVIRKINTVSQERFMQTFHAINEKLARGLPAPVQRRHGRAGPDRSRQAARDRGRVHDPPARQETDAHEPAVRRRKGHGRHRLHLRDLPDPADLLLPAGRDRRPAGRRPTSIRFNDLLQHIGEKSQIIMITHNKRTHGVRRHPLRHHHGAEGRLQGGFRQPQAA